MKKQIILLVAFLVACPVFSQTYLVYTVKGDVSSKQGSAVAQVHPGDELSGKSVITIPADGRLVVVNEAGRQLYTVKEGIGAISALVAAENCRPQAVTADYLAFIKEKATSGKKGKDVNYMQLAGTTYRKVGVLEKTEKDVPEGMLLQPLRDCWADAVAALATGQTDSLATVADRLKKMGIVRHAFPIVSDYTPQSFNGHFVFDALCLRDLSFCLDPTRPIPEQIAELPVPLTKSTSDRTTPGNILCNHYLLEPGQQLVLRFYCIGYCEIATFSLTEGIVTTLDGKDAIFITYPEETEMRVEIVNPTDSSAVVTFAVNY